MCTAGMALLGMQGVGGITSAIGAYTAAEGQKSQLNLQAANADSQATIMQYQADIADTNARLAESQAQSALTAGQRREQNVRLRTAQLKSTQRVRMAANGIDLSQGTPLQILTSTDLMGEADANAVALDALNAAWGYRTQSVNYSNQGLTTRARGSAFTAQATALRSNSDAISPWASAGSSLLGSATSVAANYYMLDKAGALDMKKPNPSNYQTGTPGYSGNYLYYDP